MECKRPDAVAYSAPMAVHLLSSLLTGPPHLCAGMAGVMSSVIQLVMHIRGHTTARITPGTASEVLTPAEHLHTQVNVATTLRTRSLVQDIYEYLPMLSDLLAWSSTSRWTRPVGQSIATQRFTRIIHPFVGDYTAEARYLMHSWGAVITGSCALQMLTGGRDTSKNLNIVVPMGSFDVLQQFILSTLSYRCVEAVTHSNYAFCAVVRSFGKYRCGRLQITLCEALADHIYDVITSSPTTADMIFMTPGGIAVLYPEWTLNGVALLNHTVASRCRDSRLAERVLPNSLTS
ncbi:hypothetical protein P692DRAFT_20879610 [Suillus brevipes Sb2]|nr:hypothetical protein P692DRAFT_20879610 [Suillus brevipes Sb2]